nr:EOG090X0APE [Triops cancriformis]
MKEPYHMNDTTKKVYTFSSFGKSSSYRSIWQLTSSSLSSSKKFTSNSSHITPWGQSCACGCGIQGLHTKGDKELVEFLAEEIQAEKRNQKSKSVPTNFDGFEVKANGAELELSKKFNDETIIVNFHVNHSVDAEVPEELDTKADASPDVEMKCKPQFEVRICKGNKVIRLACSFVQDTGAPQDPDTISDVYTIDEIAVYEGEAGEKTYAVSGDILDGYMYDLLMNMLEERGVSNEFAEKVTSLTTSFEHGLYINLLEKLQDFIQSK